MMYLLKVMIFHGELLNNQMVIDVYITRKYPSSSHIPQDRENLRSNPTDVKFSHRPRKASKSGSSEKQRSITGLTMVWKYGLTMVYGRYNELVNGDYNGL